MTGGSSWAPVLVATLVAVALTAATPSAAHESDVDPATAAHVHVDEDAGVLGNGVHAEANVTCAPAPGGLVPCSASWTVDPHASMPDLPCFWIGGTHVCVA